MYFRLIPRLFYTSRGIRIFGDMGVVVFPLIHLETFRKKWPTVQKITRRNLYELCECWLGGIH
jgi:hypothetical protein